MAHGRAQKLPGESPAPVGAGDEEAGDGPDRLRVDRSEQSRGGEPRERGSRLDGTPPHRFLALVREQARDHPGADLALHGAAVPVAAPGVEGCPGDLPPHAPAAGAGAPRAEERRQVREPLRRQRVKREAPAHLSMLPEAEEAGSATKRGGVRRQQTAPLLRPLVAYNDIDRIHAPSVVEYCELDLGGRPRDDPAEATARRAEQEPGAVNIRLHLLTRGDCVTSRPMAHRVANQAHAPGGALIDPGDREAEAPVEPTTYCK